MRLLPDHHNQSVDKRAGFTLVEMLVIAPLVLLVIAGLVAAMVAMIGDSLIANSRADTAYSIQDTLSQIEQDSRVATGFMGTFSYLTAPQGRAGGTQPFSYSSNKDLILTQQATTASPYSNNRQLVYYANQPASCGGDTSGNRTLFNRVVYFLLTNGDGTKSLWRRTILNPWNTNATPDGNTVCSAPWQRSSCPVGSTTSSTPGATCQSIDQKMLDNVTSFVPTFYTSSGSTTSDPTQANSVGVSITVAKKVSGNNISQTSVVRASRRNDVPPTPVPSAPTITLYNPGVNAYNNPILTSVQWSAPNAYTYVVSTKVGAGAWSAATTTANTNISIDSTPGAVVQVKVTAVNDSGQSTTTTQSFTTDTFTDINLAGNWDCYSGGTTYYCPQFTRLSSGIVMLRGLAADGTGVITTLPAGFRPKARLIFPVLVTGNAVGRVDIETNGTVSIQAGDGSGWVSLDDIRFPATGAGTSFTWTNPTFGCDSCTTAWHNYGGSYQTVQFSKDVYGRDLLFGLASIPTPYPPTLYTPIVNTPSSPDYLVPATNGNYAYPSLASNAYSSVSITRGNQRVEFRVPGGTWQSLAIIYPGDGYTPSWQTPSLQNSWVNYNTNSYTYAGYSIAPDDMVMIKGRIKSGTTTNNTLLFTLPAGYRPTKRMIFMTTGYLSGTGEVSARIDVMANGNVTILSSTGKLSNNWLNVDGISFYQEQ